MNTTLLDPDNPNLNNSRHEKNDQSGHQSPQPSQSSDSSERQQSSWGNNQKLRCYRCKKPGHVIRDCPSRKKESESHGPSHPASTKQILADTDESPSPKNIPEHPQPDESSDQFPDPRDVLFPDSDGEKDVRQVKVTDSGSHTQFVRVEVQGVPADGVVDTAADITIMGGKLFALVASAARLRKKNFRAPDKVPRTYDRKVFRLDGCMDMDISFGDKTLNTTVYNKMDAADQLLLSEGVC